jgi:hypothetical protein
MPEYLHRHAWGHIPTGEISLQGCVSVNENRLDARFPRIVFTTTLQDSI